MLKYHVKICSTQTGGQIIRKLDKETSTHSMI